MHLYWKKLTSCIITNLKSPQKHFFYAALKWVPEPISIHKSQPKSQERSIPKAFRRLASSYVFTTKALYRDSICGQYKKVVDCLSWLF